MSDRIACAHMSGLMSRSHMTAAKMGSATRGPNTIMTFDNLASGAHGLARVLGSIDHAIYSFSSKLRTSRRRLSAGIAVMRAPLRERLSRHEFDRSFRR